MSAEDKMEMLKWLSASNTHVSVSDLAFLLGLPAEARNEGEACESQMPVQ